MSQQEGKRRPGKLRKKARKGRSRIHRIKERDVELQRQNRDINVSQKDKNKTNYAIFCNPHNFHCGLGSSETLGFA